MRYRVAILAFLALLIAGSALSQASFEVAAIKPGDPNNRQSGVHWAAGGRVANTNATVKALIAFAYGLPEEQILGGEKWVSSDEYSIVAKPDSDSPIPSGDAGYLKMKTLFQQLLGDRIKLKVHSENKTRRSVQPDTGEERQAQRSRFQERLQPANTRRSLYRNGSSHMGAGTSTLSAIGKARHGQDGAEWQIQF